MTGREGSALSLPAVPPPGAETGLMPHLQGAIEVQPWLESLP